MTPGERIIRERKVRRHAATLAAWRKIHARTPDSGACGRMFDSAAGVVPVGKAAFAPPFGPFEGGPRLSQIGRAEREATSISGAGSAGDPFRNKGQGARFTENSHVN